MILAIRYTVKGVKKGYKKYQAHQLEKEQAARGIMPDLDDPSRELDATCQAERTNTASTEDSRSRSSSESTRVAEKALEDDPEFQRYMEKHRSLYLQQQRGLPPAYEATESRTEMPAPIASPSHSSPVQPVSALSDGEHCTCHNCLATRQSHTPISATGSCTRGVQELPAPMGAIAELDVPEIRVSNSSQIFKSPSSHVEDDNLVLCEMPGDLPAILPEKRSPTPSELVEAPA